MILCEKPALLAGIGMQPTSQDGLIMKHEHTRKEVRVSDDVYALNVDQDIPGLAKLPDTAKAAGWQAARLRAGQEEIPPLEPVGMSCWRLHRRLWDGQEEYPPPESIGNVGCPPSPASARAAHR